MADRSNSKYPTIVEAMTLADIADYAEVKLDTLRHFHKQGQGGLPEPKVVLAGRPIWERAAIDQWLANRRGPGRPRTPPPTQE